MDFDFDMLDTPDGLELFYSDPVTFCGTVKSILVNPDVCPEWISRFLSCRVQKTMTTVTQESCTVDRARKMSPRSPFSIFCLLPSSTYERQNKAVSYVLCILKKKFLIHPPTVARRASQGTCVLARDSAKKESDGVRQESQGMLGRDSPRLARIV